MMILQSFNRSITMVLGNMLLDFLMTPTTILVFAFALISCTSSESDLVVRTWLQQHSSSSLTAQKNVLSFLGPSAFLYDQVEAYSINYPNLKADAYFALLREKATGNLTKIAFSDDGSPTSGPEMQFKDLLAKNAQLGRLGEHLHTEFLAATSPSPKVFDVSIAYRAYDVVPKSTAAWNSSATIAQVSSGSKQRRLIRAQMLAPTRSVVLATINAMGGSVISAPVDAPVVYAKMPAAAVAAFSNPSFSPSVLSVELSKLETVQPAAELFYDSDDMEAKEAYLDLGKHGTGIKVGLFEHVSGCGIWRLVTRGGVVPVAFKDWSGYTQKVATVANGCASLADGTVCPQGCGYQLGRCRSGVCMADHATEVVSHIGATVDCINCGQNQDRYANEAHIYFANDGLVTQRYSWFVERGVHIVNESQYMNSSNANNWAVRNDEITLTHISGNDAVTNPVVTCYANAICVGTALINGSISSLVDAWKSDPEDVSDSYIYQPGYRYLNGIQNRSYPDIEKPDVLAMAGPSLAPDSGQWVGCNGTSCAAPKVAGLVALLQEHAPFTASWPELVRPLIMASAISHNVDAAQLSLNSGYDEQDGAGVPVASVLKKIIDNVWYTYGFLEPANFNSSNEAVQGSTISLQPGQGLRVVFGYTHCVEQFNDASNNEFLAIDLDLQLFVNGQLVGWSWSSNNSLEFWEYRNDSASNQNVKIVIKKYGQWQSCNGWQHEYFGIAWVKHTGYLVN